VTKGNWTHWALDVSLSAPCFVPVEMDDAGNVKTIVWGMTLVADRAPGNLIGVVHQGGQDAVEKWCDENPDEVARLFPR
jgi:hypothetical protein